MDNNDSKWPKPLAGDKVTAPLLPYPYGTQGFGPEGLETASEIRGAFWELNSCGEMFLYDKGGISHCSLSRVFHQ
ncbi:MAG: hypothetical protein SPK08_02260 [Candidatus Cryptobacteroides sp.]|nr:hypothetical protein [Rikenellaceae bacterium]MDY5746348.1 hypothetical protein [Candidatus Cryptobacteroides sp.]